MSVLSRVDPSSISRLRAEWVTQNQVRVNARGSRDTRFKTRPFEKRSLEGLDSLLAFTMNGRVFLYLIAPSFGAMLYHGLVVSLIPSSDDLANNKQIRIPMRRRYGLGPCTTGSDL